jgi:hypothetical protein
VETLALLAASIPLIKEAIRRTYLFWQWNKAGANFSVKVAGRHLSAAKTFLLFVQSLRNALGIRRLSLIETLNVYSPSVVSSPSSPFLVFQAARDYTTRQQKLIPCLDKFFSGSASSR